MKIHSGCEATNTFSIDVEESLLSKGSESFTSISFEVEEPNELVRMLRGLRFIRLFCQSKKASNALQMNVLNLKRRRERFPPFLRPRAYKIRLKKDLKQLLKNRELIVFERITDV